LIAGVDKNVVRILDLMDELGLTENKIVVYASDNGLCNGAHGTFIKRAAYEESIRVPLLVRYPPLVWPGMLVDRLALNVDLAPTLLELAGVEEHAATLAAFRAELAKRERGIGPRPPGFE